MNDHDHAVVIGIGRYADAGKPPVWIEDLRGPVNDAAAIAAWLRDPHGGGLPHGNVQVIQSEAEPDPFPEGGAAPAQKAVMDALDSVLALPINTYAPGLAGRRFYL